jgi:DNA-binding CsgD family transcriptional regulator
VSVELAGALEDLAVVAAGADQVAQSRRFLGEAVELFTGIGAHWDVRRSQARLRRIGIRRGVHGRRPARPRHGWSALTPTEQRVALLVAEGRSTADISHSLYVSPRTAQTHISRILTKLELRSRVEIARAAAARD